MKKTFAKLYIQPFSTGYQLLDYLNHNMIKINLFIVFLIIGYPVADYILQSYQYKQLKDNRTVLLHTREKQSALLTALQKRQNEISQKDTNLAKITEQLKDILINNFAKEENIQWQFSDNIGVSITAAQTSPYLLRIITALNQLEKLTFKEITLTKLHREKLVQLNTTLILKE